MYLCVCVYIMWLRALLCVRLINTKGGLLALALPGLVLSGCRALPQGSIVRQAIYILQSAE